jgi:SRSO17 transposase
LYLPEETWHNDRERCRAAGIPDSVVYRPKWQIALDILDRSIENGMRYRYIAADEFYGRAPEFREGISKRGLIYVVEVPCSTTGWTKMPMIIGADVYSGVGRIPQKERVALGQKRAQRVEDFAKRLERNGQAYHVKDTEKGPAVWRVYKTRFFPTTNHLPGQACTLMIARNVLDGEVKYFLSNASEDIPVEKLLHVAFSRSKIERLFEDAKGQVGFDHFEVRHYRPLMRHLILSLRLTLIEISLSLFYSPLIQYFRYKEQTRFSQRRITH